MPERLQQCESPERLQREASEPLRLCALLTDLYLLCTATVFLLFFGPKGLAAITSAKRDFFYWSSGIYAALALPAAAFALWKHPDARSALLRRLRAGLPVYLCMGAYLLLTLLSALCSVHGEKVWIGASRNEGFVTQAAYVGVLLLVGLLARPRRRLLWAFGLGMSLLCALCVLHVAGLDPLRLFPRGQNYENTKRMFLGTVGNVGFIGGLLCVAVPAFAVTVLRGRRRQRFFALLPLALCLLLLALIDVLAAYVGLGLGGLLCLPFVLPLSRRGTRRYFLGLGLCALAAGLVLWRFDFGGFFHELHALLHLRWADSFGSGRFFIWRQTLERVGGSWALGTGPDTMLLERLAPFTRFDAQTGKTVTASIDAAHNEYLNILFHQGVFALLAYLGALGFALRVFFRRARENAWIAGSGAAVLCYAIEAFFGIAQPLTKPFFILALALLLAADAAQQDGPGGFSAGP